MARAIDGLSRFGRQGLFCAVIVFAACTRTESTAPEAAGAPGVLAAPDAVDGASASSSDPLARIAQLEGELAAARGREERAESDAARLRTELAASEEKRMAREKEWLEYSQLLGMVSTQRLPGGKPFAAELPGSAPAEPDAAATPIDPNVQARSRELALALTTLFTLEQVRSMDLLECGTLEGDSIGPVVFRLLDGQGRLAGSLYANHLRMEASRSARTITLVLEDGYETRGGEKIPFDAGAPERKQANLRRVVLDGIDPLSWADEFRELFGEKGLDLSGDDGLWDLVLVKTQLNEFLKSQTAGGTYRLRELGGVQDGTLISVHLERADASGAIERRLFADRMRISRSGSGVEIALENGVQVRGQDERVPFLDGRYRILLPAADGSAWTRAGLPGLAPPPGTVAARKPDGSDSH